MSIQFQERLKKDQVPQSLLLVGATKEDAVELAKQLLGISHAPKIDSGNHPDFHFYFPDEKSGLHPIANIQKIIAEMALPPFEAKRKVFLIDQAEKMLPVSSNALLKTLEEPNEDTFFLLTSHRPKELLDTIRSRLYPLTFTPPNRIPMDLSSLFVLAEEQRWDRLLDEIPEVEPEIFFEEYLKWIAKKKNPELFLKLSAKVSEGQTAILHHLKPRAVYGWLCLFLGGEFISS